MRVGSLAAVSLTVAVLFIFGCLGGGSDESQRDRDDDTQSDSTDGDDTSERCPSGYQWNDTLGFCAPIGTDGDVHDCPPGQIWSDALGQCVVIGTDGDQDAEEQEVPVEDTGVAFRLLDVQQSGSNIMLFVSVNRTPSATPIGGLTESDFLILEDGESIGVESSLQVDARPSGYVWRTLVMFDTSRSVLSQGQLDDVVDAIRGFAHKITDRDTRAQQVSIAAFDGASNLRTINEFTAQQGIVDAALDRLLEPECSEHSDCEEYERPQCEGGLCVDIATNLYGAVIRGIEEADRAIGQESRIGMPRGSSVVVFTDGTDRASRATLEDVQTSLAETKTYVFTVGLAGEVDTGALNVIGRDGSSYVETIDQMSQGLTQIWQIMQKVGQGIYLLSYCTPKRNGQHEIKIGLADYADEEIILSFDANDTALCDQDAPTQACVGKTCGEGGNGNFYCGDCAAREYCNQEHQCQDACRHHESMQLLMCDYSPYDYDILCGLCAQDEYCDENLCKDYCYNYSEEKIVECGESPVNNDVICGDCSTGTYCYHGSCLDSCTHRNDEFDFVCDESPYEEGYSCGSCEDGYFCSYDQWRCVENGGDYCGDGGACSPQYPHCFEKCGQAPDEVWCCSDEADEPVDCRGNTNYSCEWCCIPGTSVAVSFDDGTYSCCEVAYPYPCVISGERRCCTTSGRCNEKGDGRYLDSVPIISLDKAEPPNGF